MSTSPPLASMGPREDGHVSHFKRLLVVSVACQTRFWSQLGRQLDTCNRSWLACQLSTRGWSQLGCQLDSGGWSWPGHRQTIR